MTLTRKQVCGAAQDAARWQVSVSYPSERVPMDTLVYTAVYTKVRGPSEYWFFSVSIGFSRNKRAVTSQPVDFFAIGLQIRNPRGKPVLKTL